MIIVQPREIHVLKNGISSNSHFLPFLSSFIYRDHQYLDIHGLIPVHGRNENEAKGKLLIFNQSETPTLAELSALPTSRHQRKEMLATSQVRLLSKLLRRSKPMWRLSGRNHDPSRLPTHGWIGFGTL
ncbi:hypothetical protein M514_25770 [Trichuris suis]|uniref:Uncharacterized protein n=1 Tax=Trichuris suis TaxID=68888 RepID=A0A085MXV5_9BILA|nr:hypothetical protein M514_25770 [Trichuris suis]